MNRSYFPDVVQAVAGPDKTVYAYFTDGRITQVDLKPQIERGGVFAPLSDDAVFANTLTVMNNTVTWDLNGKRDSTECIDIDPFVAYDAQIVDDPLELSLA